MSDNGCVLGIDPGLSGAMAFLFPLARASQQIVAEDLPVIGKEIDAAAFARRLREMQPVLAVVEKVHSMPKQGVASTFKFGASYGTVLGVLGALEISTRRVASGVWKKHYGLSSDKDLSRALAVQIWPGAACFERKRDHGRAEAALLAQYGAWRWGDAQDYRFIREE